MFTMYLIVNIYQVVDNMDIVMEIQDHLMLV